MSRKAKAEQKAGDGGPGDKVPPHRGSNRANNTHGKRKLQLPAPEHFPALLASREMPK